jgi:hypothetical protein
VERLEQHAKSLAANQPVSGKSPKVRSLVARLADNERILLETYRAIAKVADEKRPVTPASEWLLDNYHLVERQVREVRTDLPVGYYRQLPKLSSGPLAGYPRVFGLAWAFVAHTDSRFDPEALTRFVRAYQTVQALSIGELWAVAITLRIVLVENLRRAAVDIMSRRSVREEADVVADRLMGVNGLMADQAALAPYERAPLSEGFIVQLVQRLRDQDPQTTPAVGWLEERLRHGGIHAEELVRREHQLQGASNVTVRNIITSMRLISDVDWAKLFEEGSVVDDRLRAGSEFAATAQQHDARDGEHEGTSLPGNQVTAQDEDAASLALGPEMRARTAVRTSISRATCRSCTYELPRSFRITRSTASPLRCQYSRARKISRTRPESSISSMRTRTMGTSPEMPCAHRRCCGARPRLIASEEERSAGLA